MQKIVTCLVYETQAEEAVNFYLSIFKDGKIHNIRYYGPNQYGPEGAVLSVDFTMFGQEFLAVNGGSHFKFTEAISLMVQCDSQEEIDTLWEKLSEGGQKVECGWLTDKFGVSWQIVPAILSQIMRDPNHEKTNKVMDALLTMKKLDLARLKQAYDSV